MEEARSLPIQLGAPRTLQRPKMPTDDDQERAVLIEARWQMMRDNHDDIVVEYMKGLVGDERTSIMGQPDISVNPLATQCHQLTTPGLYGIAPTWKNSDPNSDIVIGPDGQFVKAGWSTKMQKVQYFCVGLGDFLIRYDLPIDVGHVTARLVEPFLIAVQCDPDRPLSGRFLQF